jgi:hypothetical protein
MGIVARTKGDAEGAPAEYLFQLVGTTRPSRAAARRSGASPPPPLESTTEFFFVSSTLKR